MPNVSINGSELYYESQGDGEPLVLISGYMADHTSWAPLLPVFSKKYRTIVLDNRGVGRTVTPDGPFTIEDMGDDVAGLLEALNLDKAHVIGVSMGGRIAQALAIRHPDKIKGLVLCSTTARVPGHSRFVLALLAEELEKGRISYEFHDQMMLAWTFSDRMFSNPDILKRMLAGAEIDRVRPTPANMIRQLRAGQYFDSLDDLERINVPTLVVHGSNDVLFPIEYGRELAEGISGSRLVVLEGGAHGAYLEMAEKFISAVLSFLADVDAKHH